MHVVPVVKVPVVPVLMVHVVPVVKVHVVLVVKVHVVLVVMVPAPLCLCSRLMTIGTTTALTRGSTGMTSTNGRT